MLDAIIFERLGIPAVVIITELFANTARAMARLQGVADYPMVLVPHPMSNLTDEQVRERALKVVPKVVSLLVERA